MRTEMRDDLKKRIRALGPRGWTKFLAGCVWYWPRWAWADFSQAFMRAWREDRKR
jgi:hypothetical protein